MLKTGCLLQRARTPHTVWQNTRALSSLVSSQGGHAYSSTKKSKSKTFPLKYKAVKMRYGQDARNAVTLGISRLADVSQKTLGPGGRNIVLDYEGGDPKITKDGVTVVKTIHLSDRTQELGAKLLKQAAGNTNTYAGDGTTTASILCKHLMTHGNKAI